MLVKRAFGRFAKVMFLVLLMLMMTTPALAYFAPGNGQAATLALGQPDFVNYYAHTTQTGMYAPSGVAVDPVTQKVFVVEAFNNRVLRFGSLASLTTGAAAEAVLGQPDFTTAAVGHSQNGMSSPSSASVDASGRLWVADAANNRVLGFDNASTITSGANASVVLGQPDFTTSAVGHSQNGMYIPEGVFADAGGRLWVADSYNSRVLRFDNADALADGANAAVVLGQPNFTSQSISTGQASMHYPYGLAGDSSGRLWVADSYNSRVLRFDNAASKATGANADGVLGEPDFTTAALVTTQSGMSHPIAVAVDSSTGRLYVADADNSRVLVFNSAAALPNGSPANVVLGQTDFTTGTGNTGGLTATSLRTPWGVFYDPYAKVLWVADTYNDRALMYGSRTQYSSARSAAAYDGWVLESSETSNVGGALSAAGLLRLGDDASNRQYRAVLHFNTSGLPDTGMTIRAVTLKIRKSAVTGANPFSSLGYLLADMKKGPFGTAPLEITDFQASASANAIAHFTAVTGQPGWYQLVVPKSDFGYINRAGITQFRLRFAKDDNNNGVANYVSIYAGNTSIGTNRPLLTVEYTKP